MTRNTTRLLAVLFLMMASVLPWASHANVVEATLPSGKIATANVYAGKNGRPAVLIIHGFLQTREFPTVVSMADTLSSAGHTVVTPTLSLGISRRNKSLACEALHLHSLDEDVEEIAFWVEWLRSQGHAHIILAGHSYGNVQLLAYLQGKPSAAVRQALMVSLTDVEVKQSAQQRARIAEELRERVAKKDKKLAKVEFGHCRNYVSSPAALLSYLSVSRGSILDALAKSPVPATVIMGGKDDRMGSDWVGKLKARDIQVRVVPGASHFFDNQYEFDLQEAVSQAVRGGG